MKYPHPVGIVIGDGAQIGKGVRVYQNVTIGRRENDINGAYPRIGDEVVIYAGAVIAGAVTVGSRSVIGANAVITSDVPPDSVAFGHNQHRPRNHAD